MTTRQQAALGVVAHRMAIKGFVTPKDIKAAAELASKDTTEAARLHEWLSDNLPFDVRVVTNTEQQVCDKCGHDLWGFYVDNTCPDCET